MLNDVFLHLAAFLLGVRGGKHTLSVNRRIAIWAGVAVRLLWNTAFALILCWACDQWLDQRGLHLSVIWIAVWFLANAPLRWNLRDTTPASEV